MRDWSPTVWQMRNPASAREAAIALSCSEANIREAVEQLGIDVIVLACAEAVTFDSAARLYCSRIVVALPRYELARALRKYAPFSDAACVFFLSHLEHADDESNGSRRAA